MFIERVNIIIFNILRDDTYDDIHICHREIRLRGKIFGYYIENLLIKIVIKNLLICQIYRVIRVLSNLILLYSIIFTMKILLFVRIYRTYL